ncbi:hemagglutinin repeat-containing protein [Cronobacter turicensis]|uniref:hemagglutinin repeat-containing protein n=2 Tax=Cronobacter turicensis TaxID=413502 RepID=UPI0024C33FF2|nr:hemagglutinin repeat-containing protein [Cronobacter turicensis]MDK1186920.1 hemagglutinin repeat-containing protein [Cronobacter turicensis]MDK1208011.1 hemagglutinin repeat-containing protein [Cronobacter turicensis]MDK1216632.1 hemagglutinin repeat-containing protein [Cronobacter turicensis]MDK1220302.1 hemagglutinin repeat-containing protein [Cronobacter turicensis]MDK1232000.1 hemagglutinin repeat-containing protein [Cronobacter turicensis]
MDTRQPPVRFSARLLSYLVISLLVWQPVAPAFAAAMTPTGPTAMDKAGNGVPVVNIARPNAAGISHNQFKDYNVGQEGVILNNATGQLNKTQLGGLIQNNPNLKAGQEARGIINEVTGGSRSQLNGYTEVAGKAANVMVANPYGITCNGCGFINTPNVTLTTGKPVLDAAGNLSALEVTRGTITVEGKGLDASQSDALSIISRATEVNAAIHARDLNVTAGANRVNADGSRTAMAGEGNAPLVAVDTGALGGMYANRIRLVSGDKGVGVNLGNLNARQGDITLDASGKLTVKNSLASGNLTAKGDNVTLMGEHKTGGTLAVSSRGNVALDHAALASDGAMTLAADGTLSASASTLTSGQSQALNGKTVTLDNNSRLDAKRDVTLTGGALASQAQINVGGNAQIAGDSLTNSGQIAATGRLDTRTSRLNNRGTLQGNGVTVDSDVVTNSGVLQSASALTLKGKTLDQQGTVSARGDAALNFTDSLRNGTNGKILTEGTLAANTGELEQNGTLSGTKRLDIQAQQATSGKGALTTSQGDIRLDAVGKADLNGQTIAAGNLTLTGDAVTTQQDAQLQSGRDLAITAHDATLDGTHAAKGALNVTAQRLSHGGKSDSVATTFQGDESLNNSGTLTGDALTLRGKQITNRGLLKGSGALNLSTDHLDNLAGGTLYSPASLNLAIPTLTNQGQITTDGDLTLRGAQLTNGGLLQSHRALDMAYESFDNLSGGTLYSARDLHLAIPTLTNQGLISTDGDLSLRGQSLVNSGEINGVNLSGDIASLNNTGRLLADNALTLKADTLSSGGTLAAEQVTIAADQLQNQGLVQGNRALNVTAGDTDNQGALRTGGTLALDGGTLTNGGELSATALLLSLAKHADNRGKLVATDALRLTTPAFTNTGTLAAATLDLDSAAVTNSGALQATGDVSAHGKQFDNQQGGVVLAGGALALNQNTLSNAGLLQGDTLAVAAQDWRNEGNALGQDGVTAQIDGTLTNQGNVLSQQALDIRAGNTDNRGALMAKVLALHGDLQNSGLLQGSDALNWDGATLSNAAGGKLTGGNTLALNGTTLDNQGQMQGRALSVSGDNLRNGGTLQATDSLNATLSQTLENNGALLSQNQAEVSAAQLTNDGTLAARALTVQAPGITNHGTLAGNDSLSLTTRNLYNGAHGQLATGGGLTLDLDRLENQGQLSVNDGLTLRGNTLINGGDINAAALDATLSGALDNAGRLMADGRAQLTAGTMTNSGTLAADDVTLGAGTLHNSGLIQGAQHAQATAQTLTNDASGTWLSGGALTLNGNQLTNAGQVQGDTLTLTAGSLDNRGVINGIQGLTGTVQGALTNDGQMVSHGDAALNADSLTGSGRMVADTLTLQANRLTNNGLWQGAKELTATADTLTTGANARTLSGGDLSLNAGTLNTGGTLQGQQVNVDADNWTHGGTLISLGGLGAQTRGTLTNNGSLLSQGAATVTAGELANNGSLLSQGALTLDGQRLTNRGALQGDTLSAYQNQINNQGTLTGVQGLTLTARPQPRMARMLLAVPARELINGANGALLTGGTLRIDSGAVTNAGRWQGQNILLNAQRLDHRGAIQSADGLNITLSGDLNSLAGSKITALGTAALNALAMTNQGEWAAKNLTLTGNSLRNDGAITGVNGLTATVNNDLTQSSGGKLLTGGALTASAGSMNNQGAVQGGTLDVTTGGLTNSGRLQGDNGVTLTARGSLTNNAGGQIVSRQDLAVTTPVLLNDGLMQGGGATRVEATTSARNDGKLLSGGQLTLTTPQFTGAGWLQATNLILNAANATNSGTWLADQGTLTGTSFTNQGTTQGGALTVNYGTLNNNGTLLGNNQLTVNASQVNQQAAGKLFSGGDLWIGSAGLDAAGQLVALGNLTLKLTNAFTNNNALAAGKTLTVTSNGAIDNRGVLQGQAVNVSAGGALTNNGQITTGSGASTLGGSGVALNGAGTLQGGGDVTIASRGNITVDGFTGTRGSLTLTAPGNIVNTALLYAANNLALYANSITNQRGDILAGNSLWMQKDAAGNANTEVVNTSGNIETQNGDITIKTASLRNERAGLQLTMQTQSSGSTYAWMGQPNVNIPVADLGIDTLVQDSYIALSNETSGSCSGVPCFRYAYNIIYYHPLKEYETRKFILEKTQQQISAEGSGARISSGRNLMISAGVLNNQASNIIANNNINLEGKSLNNQSYQAGTHIKYAVYNYSGPKPGSRNVDTTGYTMNGTRYLRDVAYKFENYVTETENGELYRAVIQAGGNVTANFADNISNTSTTANAGKVSITINTPPLNTLSHQSIGGSVQKQSLAGGAAVAVNSPEWKDQLQGALQQINGGGALENSAGGSALANLSATKAGKANLGNTSGLASAGVTAASAATITGGALANTPGKPVDTSAYPLPSGSNGFFVVSDNPKSPYLINVNPKLDGLGELDPTLFGDLNKLLGVQPGAAPRETRASFTNEKQFLGSSYMLGRLNLNPEYDYRFLGDAAFDTRYVSNTLLNQTGNRYLNGVGSDLQQMQYLMDSAAAQQKSLGLQFGVALTRDQIASLDKSILWWESATVNGETVMIPKLYLSPKDVTVNNGSVIAGNNVSLKGGDITNSGSTLLARQDLKLDSQNSISNLNDGLMKAGGGLSLSAIGDINNISSAIRGKTVALESADGSINNITLAEQTSIDARGKYGSVMLKDTTLGSTATISAQDSLALQAGKNITLTSANLTSGGDLLMNAWGDIAVNANQVNDAYGQSGLRNNTNTSRSSVTYQGSTLSAGGNLGIKAGDNLSVAAGDIKAGGNAALAAGGDLNLDALQTSKNSQNGKKETHSTGLDRTTVSAGDNLTLSAGRDINAHAAALAAEDNIGVQAGRDVNLNAEATTSGDSYRSKKKTTINESVRQQGTELASGGNTVIVAGRDMNADAAQATAKGDIGVTAGRDINLATATESDYHYKEETKTKKGFLKKTTTHTVSEQSATREAGTLLSGDNVTLKAGEDLLVKGSAVAGDGNVALSAGKNVEIAAATNTDSNWQLKEKKKSGLMGSGGIGFTIGSSKTRHELKEKGTTQSQSVSTVGSTGGNVTVTAGEQARVSGADLVAGKNLTLTGDSVVIEPGHDKRTSDQKFEQKSSGLTVALTGAVVDAVNNAVTAAKDATKQSDSRLAALQATKSVLSGYQAVQGKEMADTTGEPNAGIRVSVSLTTQKSKSEQHQVSDQVTGSTLNAGNNLSINATGKNHGANSGDIVVAGSSMKAGGDASLNAARDILLTGAANTQKTTGSNSSSGGGVGVSFGVGQGSAGLSVFANVNAAKGKEKGDGTDWTETTLDSGGKVSLHSGQDASLIGAQVSGSQVTADIGRNLTITSLQDSNHYDSKQSSVSAGGSFTFGSMTGSGYVNFSQDKMHSTFKSVAEQSGIFAGKDGFDVTVGSHTQLNGAVIGSTAAADKNRLETGTLSFTDIGNKADYKVSHKGGTIGAGTGSGSLIGLASSGLSAVSGAMLSGLGSSGHASGTTQSAVSEGTIVIRDKAGQQQDVASLSRDVANANDTVSPIFNKEKEQKRLQIAQMTGDIAGQMTTMVMTEGDINALKAARAVPGNAHLSAEELKQTQAYRDAFSEYGTGGKYQQIAQSASAAIAGLVNGDFSGAVAGAAAPYIATFVKNHTDEDSAQRILAHALAGAVIAKAQGKDVLAGAAGASTGELTAKLALDLYGKKPEQLGEDERQLVSALSSVAAGLAGAAVSDNTAGVQAAAQAGKNAVENNYLSATEAEIKAVLEHKEKAGILTGDETKELADIRRLDKERDQVIHDICTKGNKSGGACTALVEKAQNALNTYGASVTYSLIFKDLYPQDAANAGAILKGLDEESITRDAAITAIAKKNNTSWDKAASQYDKVMQLHGFVSTLAGFYGANWISEAEGQVAKSSPKNIYDGAGDTSLPPKVRIEYSPEGTYINQTSHESGGSNLCGPTTCAMVISDKKGKVVNLDSVVKQFDDIRPTGVNINEMSTVLSKNGVVNQPTNTLLPNQLRDYASQGRTTIVNIDTGKGGHFIVVDSMKKVDGVDYYMIRDPFNGPAGVRTDVLDKRMNFNGIVLE